VAVLVVLTVIVFTAVVVMMLAAILVAVVWGFDVKATVALVSWEVELALSVEVVASNAAAGVEVVAGVA